MKQRRAKGGLPTLPALRIACGAAILFAGERAAVAKPGDHIRAGGATITPTLDVGVEYQTNVYHEDTDPQGGVDLRVAPSVAVGFETENNKLSFSAEYDLRKQLWLQFDESQVPLDVRSTLDQASATSALDQYDSFSAGLAAAINRQHLIGFDLAEGISYKNNIVDSEFSESPYLTLFQNKLAGDVRLHTGGAIEVKGGGAWQYDDYRVPEYFATADEDPGSHDSFNKRNTYGPTLSVAWSFFPTTALVLEGRYEFVRWQNNEISSLLVDPADGTAGDPVSKPDSDVLRVQTGVRGRITEKLRADLLVGYGFANYLDSSLPPTATALGSTDTSGLQGLLLTAQFGYLVKEGSSVAFGYKRDFADVFFTNYMSSDFLFVQADSKLDHVTFSARYGIRFERYRGEVVRNDTFNRAAFDGRYNLTKWLQTGVGVWWQHRWSNQDLVEYDDVGVNALLSFSY